MSFKICKIVIIGDVAVGKTSIVQRFTKGTFSQCDIGIGIGMDIKSLNIENKNIRLQIWDTAGQERFRSISRTYYRGVHGFIIVYDITQKNTFINIVNWLNEISTYGDANVPVVLLGNKCDLQQRREVHEKDCEALVKAKPVILRSWETSVKDEINISAPFEFLATCAHARVKTEKTSDNKIQLDGGGKRNCC